MQINDKSSKKIFAFAQCKCTLTVSITIDSMLNFDLNVEVNVTCEHDVNRTETVTITMQVQGADIHCELGVFVAANPVLSVPQDASQVHVSLSYGIDINMILHTVFTMFADF